MNGYCSEIKGNFEVAGASLCRYPNQSATRISTDVPDRVVINCLPNERMHCHWSLV